MKTPNGTLMFMIYWCWEEHRDSSVQGGIVLLADSAQAAREPHVVEWNGTLDSHSLQKDHTVEGSMAELTVTKSTWLDCVCRLRETMAQGLEPVMGCRGCLGKDGMLLKGQWKHVLLLVFRSWIHCPLPVWPGHSTSLILPYMKNIILNVKLCV